MAQYAGIDKDVGLRDLVLLEDISENAAFANIEKRALADRIYTYIGPVLVAVNPYKAVANLYGAEHVREYNGRFYYEMPPHAYALADHSYRAMMRTKLNQCVIISGESGAGKTWTSKIILQYISAISPASHAAETTSIKDQLLSSNPILEAFGNAKTQRNDNSSRFGKYMEIRFDHGGAPRNGHVTVYLLEKSRVVARPVGERSFHIFYQMLAGLGAQRLKTELDLAAAPDAYHYLAHSKCFRVDSIDDMTDFREMQSALDTLAFPAATQSMLWRLVAAVLHIGQLRFEADKREVHKGMQSVHVADGDATRALASIAKLLAVDAVTLKRALVYRTVSTGVSARQSSIGVPLDLETAEFGRDALAKLVYERVFLFLVARINDQIAHGGAVGAGAAAAAAAARAIGPSIGLLDIYGFEVFERNGFEQFCINLCNEKLQQVFIELTLRSEQAEYVAEGIKWTPIQYFDNKTIVELIEKKPVGIISMMDECCRLVSSTDQSLLEKLDTNFSRHAHYASYATIKNQKEVKPDEFRLKHYAGDVQYSVTGFLAKNKDELFRDIALTLSASKEPLMRELFPPPSDSKKRPDTAATQFRAALGSLVNTLLECQPHYVRCIKPNDEKRANVIDEQRVRHQIRYLGLVENVRVRRAGFAHRVEYDRFFRRYKLISPKTHPHWRGSARDGADALMKHLKIDADPDEYRLGKTKLFIRSPQTLSKLEDARIAALPAQVLKLQTRWRCYYQRQWYLRTRAAEVLHALWRGYTNKEAYKRNNAATRIQTIFRGYIKAKQWRKRKAAMKIEWFWYRVQLRRYWPRVVAAFANVAKDAHLGKYIEFPRHVRLLTDAETTVRKVQVAWRVHEMVGKLNDEQHALVRQKVAAYDLFAKKKDGWACQRRWLADYLDQSTNRNAAKYVATMQKMFLRGGDARVLFADNCMKLNSKNKLQLRALVVTDANIYKQDPKNYKMTKGGVPLSTLRELTVSPNADGIVCISAAPPQPDIVVDLGVSGVERASELCTVLVQQCASVHNVVLKLNVATSFAYNVGRDAKKSADSAGGKDCTLSVAIEASSAAKQTLKSDLKKGGGAAFILSVPKPTGVAANPSDELAPSSPRGAGPPSPRPTH